MCLSSPRLELSSLWYTNHGRDSVRTKLISLFLIKNIYIHNFLIHIHFFLMTFLLYLHSLHIQCILSLLIYLSNQILSITKLYRNLDIIFQSLTYLGNRTDRSLSPTELFLLICWFWHQGKTNLISFFFFELLLFCSESDHSIFLHCLQTQICLNCPSWILVTFH